MTWRVRLGRDWPHVHVKYRSKKTGNEAVALQWKTTDTLLFWYLLFVCLTNDLFCSQDSKLSMNLVNKHGENLEEKSLTICSGTDYININYQHVVCPDAATAKVSLNQITPVSPRYNRIFSDFRDIVKAKHIRRFIF